MAIIDWIREFLYRSLENYGLVRRERNRAGEVLDLLVRIAGGCILTAYLFAPMPDRPARIAYGIGALLVYAGALAGSLLARRNPRIGGYSLKNMGVTFLAGLVTSVIVFGLLLPLVILPGGPDPGYGVSMLVVILVFSGAIPWLLGLLKSFRLGSMIHYLAEDDGTVEEDVDFGWVAEPGLLSNTVRVRRLGWTERKWTARSYAYYLGLFVMSSRMVLVLVWGISAGIVLAAAATVPAIVRAVNPDVPYTRLRERENAL